MKNINKYILLLFLAVACFPMLAQQDTLKLKVMTYNLRFGQIATLEQIAEHIKSFKPDFVALEEVDCHTYRTNAVQQNGKDFISTLAYESGMFGLYGKTIDYEKGYYGIGILSKYPYSSIDKVLLPNPEKKEQRAMLVGTFEMGKDTIVFATTHLDVNSKDTREIQAKVVTDYMKKVKYPVVLGGDFNSSPNETAIGKVMMKNWFSATNTDFTYPSWNPRIKIDYLFCLPKDAWQVIRTQAVHSCLSDHLPVVTEMQLIRKK